MRLSLIIKMNRIWRLRSTSWVRWPGWLGDNTTIVGLLLVWFGWSLFLLFCHFLSCWWCGLWLLQHCGHIEPFFLTLVRIGPLFYLFNFWLLFFFVVVWRSFTVFKVCCAFEIIFIAYFWPCIHLSSRLEIEVAHIDHQRSSIRCWLFGTVDIWSSVGSSLTILMVTIYRGLSCVLLVYTRASWWSLHHSFFSSRKLSIDHLYSRIDRTLPAHSCCIELRLRLVRSCSLRTLLLCFISGHVLALSWWFVPWIIAWVLSAE